MNLSELASTGGMSALTIILVVAAVCGVYWLVRGTTQDEPLAALGGVIMMLAFGYAAYDNALGEYYGARSPAFTMQLGEEYGLETTTSLRDIVVAAEEGKTVPMTQSGKLIDVRPVVDHDVLQFYAASDGRLIARKE